jgi:hypothetical protein
MPESAISPEPDPRATKFALKSPPVACLEKRGRHRLIPCPTPLTPITAPLAHSSYPLHPIKATSLLHGRMDASASFPGGSSDQALTLEVCSQRPSLAGVRGSHPAKLVGTYWPDSGSCSQSALDVCYDVASREHEGGHGSAGCCWVEFVRPQMHTFDPQRGIDTRRAVEINVEAVGERCCIPQG